MRRAGKTPPPERAMEEAELDAWLQARRAKKPLATNASMFDGFVTAIAAGPTGADPFRWITALLAVPHSAFETGGTPEFAAIKAAADRFNVLGTDLREGRFSPRYRRKANGDVTDWCEGFMAAVNLNPAGWRDALDPGNSLSRLLRPIMSHCKNGMGLPLPGLPWPGPSPQGQPLPGLPRRAPEIPVLALSHTAIPMCVAGLRRHYHTVWHDKPRPASSRR
ncbi:YecA family protein [Mesorhizobium sp. M1409]|uniref:YecA/YgfB family protein n=2 Tax=Mesorhizobium TaxID=68287 RepID=UPI0033397F1A